MWLLALTIQKEWSKYFIFKNYFHVENEYRHSSKYANFLNYFKNQYSFDYIIMLHQFYANDLVGGGVANEEVSAANL